MCQAGDDWRDGTRVQAAAARSPHPGAPQTTPLAKSGRPTRIDSPRLSLFARRTISLSTLFLRIERPLSTRIVVFKTRLN